MANQVTLKKDNTKIQDIVVDGNATKKTLVINGFLIASSNQYFDDGKLKPDTSFSFDGKHPMHCPSEYEGCGTCVKCTNCNSCTKCNSCTTCNGCTKCNSCTTCNSCTSCNSCQKCNGCTKCNACTTCDSCTRCNNCQNGTK